MAHCLLFHVCRFFFFLPNYSQTSFYVNASILTWLLVLPLELSIIVTTVDISGDIFLTACRVLADEGVLSISLVATG